MNVRAGHARPLRQTENLKLRNELALVVIIDGQRHFFLRFEVSRLKFRV
jgi:hypothetical protein